MLFGTDKSVPGGEVHRIYGHVNTNRSKVGLDYLQQIQIVAISSHDVGIKPIGIAGISQKLLGRRRVVGILSPSGLAATERMGMSTLSCTLKSSWKGSVDKCRHSRSRQWLAGLAPSALPVGP